MVKKATDYTQIKALLEQQESFPLSYPHKVIGLNTPTFEAEIARLEAQFERLERRSHRVSANQKHIAHTLVYHAHSADEIVALLKACEDCLDIVLML